MSATLPSSRRSATDRTVSSAPAWTRSRTGSPARSCPRSLEDRPSPWAALVLGAVAAMRPGPRLPVDLEPDRLPARPPGLDALVPRPAVSRARASRSSRRCSRAARPSRSSGSSRRSGSRPTSSSTGPRPSARCSGRRSRAPAIRSTGSSSSIPIFTGISLGTLVLCLDLPERAHAGSPAVGSGVLASYLAICAVLHARALAIWRRLDSPPANARVSALPQFLSPFRWMGLSETDDEIHVAFFDIGPFASGVENPQPPTRWKDVLQSLSDFYPPPGRARIQRYEKPPASRLLEAARRAAGLAGLPRLRALPAGNGLPGSRRRGDDHSPGPALPAVVHRALGARPGPGHPAAALRLPGPAGLGL